MLQIGAFGDFVFQSSSETGPKTFDTLTQTYAQRVVEHSTISGVPVVEALGLDSVKVQLAGTLDAELCAGSIEGTLDELRALCDGKPRVLTRGERNLGTYVAQSLTISEDAWSGPVLLRATWQLDLISTRESQ